MADSVKGSISALWIIGLVYSALGALFVVLGIVLALVLEEGLLFCVIFGGIGMVFLILGIIFLAVEYGKRGRTRNG